MSRPRRARPPRVTDVRLDALTAQLRRTRAAHRREMRELADMLARFEALLDKLLALRGGVAPQKRPRPN